MAEPELRGYRGLRHIVADRRLLDGQLAIRGTRFSVSFLLSLLAQGLSPERIEEIYGPILREAIPEALSAASHAVAVPSPAVRTPIERAAELQIPGLEEVIAWLGVFPSFHDSEVTSISLNREGPSHIRVHTWNMTDGVDAQGRYVQTKDVMVTLVLEGIQELALDGFNHQNVLSEIDFGRAKKGYRLTLGGCFGVAGEIECEHLRIEFEPLAS
jgi:uncharacterized protein (DUF433 family)